MNEVERGRRRDPQIQEAGEREGPKSQCLEEKTDFGWVWLLRTKWKALKKGTYQKHWENYLLYRCGGGLES